MTNSYFLSYKEWLKLVMIFRSCDFSFLSNERPRLTTRAQVFQNQKYSNSLLFVICISLSCYICISLSCWLQCWWWLQVLTSAFLFVICISLSCWLHVGGDCKYLHLHFSFVLVDICTSLSCRWTSALIFRVGGHLHFSFVLATSALIFRVDCKYLHPHFSSADVTRATENTSPASKDWTRQMSTGQRHGCNRILVLDRNLDYPTLARWPTYFVQPPPPDDFANLCLGFAQLFCELVFWGLRNYFANLRNYFANCWQI